MLFVGAEDQGQGDDLGSPVGSGGQRVEDGLPAVQAEELGGELVALAQGVTDGQCAVPISVRMYRSAPAGGVLRASSPASHARGTVSAERHPQDNSAVKLNF